jgi:hypothetical protein
VARPLLAQAYCWFVPAVQVHVPMPMPTLHTVPHAPQWLSLARSTHAPLQQAGAVP